VWQKQIQRLAKTGRSVLEILYPGLCLCCGQSLLFQSASRFPICTSCQNELLPITGHRRCTACSIPLISELQRCTRCSKRDFAFDSNFSVYEYRGPIRQIISQFKFSNRRSLARLIAHLLAPELAGRFRGMPIVPVPGSKRSVRRRGWDPMFEVARALKQDAGTPDFPLLVRRSGGAQKGLQYQVRLENIRGAIALSRRAGRLPSRVVLIDDIFTTGATVDECARVLRRGGVKKVFVLTLAVDL